MRCPHCNKEYAAISYSVSEHICACGMVLNDLIVEGLVPETQPRSEELVSVVTDARRTKDSIGKVLNVVQRDIAKKLRSWQKRMRLLTPRERNLAIANQAIDKIAGGLSLSPHLREYILEVYKSLREKQLTRGKCVSATICAITYIAILKYKLAISFQDIVETTQLKKRKVSKLYKLYIKEVDTNIVLPTSLPFLSKYIFYAYLTEEDKQRVTIAARALVDLTTPITKVGKGPSAYVSALIYLIIKNNNIICDFSQYLKRAKISTITLTVKLKCIIDYILELDPAVYSKYLDPEGLKTYRETLK